MSDNASANPRIGRRRTITIFNAALFLVSALAILLVVDHLAFRPGLRSRIDATRTRAYTLSPQTMDLLGQLEGDWTIALVFAERDVDSAIRQQVDEVLRRYGAARPDLDLIQIDPTDPADLPAYDALLGRLRSLEGDRIAAYESALDDGVAAFRELQLFAQRQAGQLQTLRGSITPTAPARQTVEQQLALMSLMADEGGQVLDLVASARRISDEQPIPDYETARSVLGAALSQWADELLESALAFGEWTSDPDAPPVLGRFASTAQDEYRRFAGELARAADPLVTLEPLELARIGRRLAQGEVGLVIGPDRATVIPTEQLFPSVSARESAGGAVTFDRRFRGEQIISAAIRSLLIESLPAVVFVHAEDASMLRERGQRMDLVGAQALLESARIETAEWNPARGERPARPPDEPTVWIIIPPTQRQGLELSANERALLRTAEQLIEEGEPVILNLYPSLRPRYDQADPWTVAAAQLGVEADTAQVLVETVQLEPNRHQYQLAQTLRDFSVDHPIGAAVNGQQAAFVFPLPVRPKADSAGASVSVLASIEPELNRWLDDEWSSRIGAETAEPIRGPGLDGPMPLVAAVERRSPEGAGLQRALVVGSGGWLLSRNIDAITPLGEGRVVLTNPGNQELLISSVYWLAGFDDLIAASPISRQAARLHDIDRDATIRWAVISTLIVPAVILLIGLGVWFVRRR